jgi:hypothetical protein
MAKKANRGHRITYGENSNASHMDRAAADAARSRLPKAKATVSGKGNPKTTNTYTPKAKSKPKPGDIVGVFGGHGATAYNTDRMPGFSSTPHKAAGAPKTRAATTPPYAGLNKAPGASPAKTATPAPKPKAKPSSTPPKAATVPMKKASASPPAYTPEKAKPQLGKKVTSGFSGNWAGAAATDMQKRGGAKINRGGGLLGLLRKK